MTPAKAFNIMVGLFVVAAVAATTISVLNGDELHPGNGQQISELTRIGGFEVADGVSYEGLDALCRGEMHERVGGHKGNWNVYRDENGTQHLACVLDYTERDGGVKIALIEGYRHLLTIRDKHGNKFDVTAIGPGVIEGDFRVTHAVVFINDHHRLDGFSGQWTLGWLESFDDGSDNTWTDIGNGLEPFGLVLKP